MVDNVEQQKGGTGRNLVVMYAIAALVFLATMVWWSIRHPDWIPDHVVPLYAALRPSPLSFRHLIPLAIGVVYVVALGKVRKAETPRWLVLTVLVATSLLLSLAICSMNRGYREVAAPFARYGLEYYGDIPSVRNPVHFLRNFEDIRPHLSMHGRTHPPGPIIMLWVLSFLTGGNALIVATLVVALASLTVIPLYMFTHDLAGRDVARICASLYVVVPTVVLYNATSMNAVYALFSVTAIWLFYRAMDRNAYVYGPLAGLAIALTFFMSYDMANLGTFFFVVFVFGVFEKARIRYTITATSLMALTFICFYMFLYGTTGFNVIRSLYSAVHQVREDLFFMETYTPRASYWIWRFANPVEVMFFAGIPVTVMFLAEWVSRLAAGAWRSRTDKYLIAGLAMMLVFNFTYLGKSEQARVSGFYFPFIIVPAAIYLHRVARQSGSEKIVTLSVALLLAQTWLMETLLYMYW